jgi:hypothetical protein
VDDRDTSILTQVAFKGAIEWAVADHVDLTNPDQQAAFEQVFSHLTESLFLGVRTQLGGEKAGQLVHAAFPGSESWTPADQRSAQQPQMAPQPQFAPQAHQDPGGGWGATQAPQAQGYGGYQLSVKGNQFGPLPEWLFEAAAKDNVHEVYDNRDQPPGSRRPMFKSTAGGRDAPAYWAPGR